MKRKSRTKIVKRVNAFLIALVMILTSIQIPVKGAIKQDYGSITLSDIILAWYNASGVAIGNTQIANAIQSAYGDITLDDLVDAEVLYSDYIGIEGGDLKEMLGYGNLSAPLIKVNLGRLRDYLPDLPTTNVAYNALNAMFTWENSTWFENNLGAIIGTVANIGKIAYSVGTEILNEIVDTNLNLPWAQSVTLRDIYNNFTDSTYFQDLLQDSSGSGSGGGDHSYLVGYELAHPEYVPDGFRVGGIGYDFSNGNMGVTQYAYLPKDVVCASFDLHNDVRKIYYVNVSTETKTIVIDRNSQPVSNGIIQNRPVSSLISYTIGSNDYVTTFSSGVGNSASLPIGMALYVPGDLTYADEIKYYIRENNPWNETPGGGGGTGDGVTDYINKQVGNVTEENYSILSPNINVGEYMYLADGATYIETLNQITNNTDNGDYSQNGDVITNYNNTYIQNTMQETRPTVGPVASPIPAQPFISPRPTQAPEDYEAVIHQGGIPETIKQKFPFCIPWDLAAVLQNLWAPEARAPYIHWDATFGSWGKLGEVDLDFSIFNDAARIFRATTLILWIIGLVVITRNIIGG